MLRKRGIARTASIVEETRNRSLLMWRTEKASRRERGGRNSARMAELKS